VWEEATRKALAAVGVAPGWHCLDVACGTGSVTRILGAIVGPQGAVHAIDADGTGGQTAVAKLNAAGPAIYSFEQFDVTGAKELNAASFDLVFTRLLLCHMTDPVAVLKRLWSWVKPGGVLLVLDYDMAVIHAAPSDPLLEEGFDLLHKSFSVTGRRYRIGSEMQYLFSAAGIGKEDGSHIAAKIVPASLGHAMFHAVVTSLVPTIRQFGLADEAKLNALLAAIRHFGQSTEGMVRVPDMIATWKRKTA
jgi:ubiquinone/menaquinone biosynthesis C-methylase UbiE